MTLAALSLEALEKIKAYRFDRMVEKHEGPEEWKSFLKFYDLEFMEIAGRWVLLPLDGEQRPNVTILRVMASEDGRSLTIFLKDTTCSDDPSWEMFAAGFMAVCDKVPNEEFFIAVVYHEWYISELPQST